MCLRHIETSLPPLCLDVSSFSRLMLQNFHYDLIVLYIRFSKITVPLAKPEHSVCLPCIELTPLQDKKSGSRNTQRQPWCHSPAFPRCSKGARKVLLKPSLEPFQRHPGLRKPVGHISFTSSTQGSTIASYAGNHALTGTMTQGKFCFQVVSGAQPSRIKKLTPLLHDHL